jgi:hypothetical protein
VETERVLAARVPLGAVALRQVQVAGAEGDAHAERARELAGHVAVAGAGHARVELGQQQHVGAREHGIATQVLEQAVEGGSAAEVPGRHPVEGLPARRRSLGRDLVHPTQGRVDLVDDLAERAAPHQGSRPPCLAQLA